MILGRLEHWDRILAGPVWETAFRHLQGLGPEAPEGFTELMGKDMMARVMSYDTVPWEASKLEAHREFVDIQAPLQHGERIDWFPLEALAPVTDYHPDKDVRHYARIGPAPVSMCLEPGMFAVFFPEDAHMPKLVVDHPRRMKKVVVKVRLSLLRA